jgi:hypothetical protein
MIKRNKARLSRLVCRLTALSLPALGALAAAAICAPSASADLSDFGLQSVSVSETTTQAGAHPDLTMAFSLKTASTGEPFARLKEADVALPPGLIGDPQGYPECPMAEFAALTSGLGGAAGGECPQDSQVGVVSIDLPAFNATLKEPLYSLTPPAQSDIVARFGFIGLVYPFVIDFRLRSDDHGLTASVEGSDQADPSSVVTTVWGVPSDPSHDPERFTFVDAARCGGPCNGPQPSGVQPTAFLTNPTSCSGPLTVGFSVSSFAAPDTFDSQSATLPGITGCEQLPFNPSISVAPTTQEADSPSGLAVSLTVPQTGLTDPNALASSALKPVVVTLPAGTAVNTSSADGLQGCSESQIGLVSEGPPAAFDGDAPSCPDGSKIGSGTITTPVLADPIPVSFYLADQNDNPFHSLLAGYLVAQGEGVLLKLPGRFDLDPHTGRITATFNDNPQLPFSDLELQFKGGPRGVLVTPPGCGSYDIKSSLSPWSASDPNNPSPAETKSFTQSFQITSGPGGGSCASGSFNPGLEAGVSNPAAGASSSFVLRLTRGDGEQNISQLTTVLPPGLVANLSAVPLCPDVLAATGACPASSQVGSTEVGVGAGPSPLYIPQSGKDPTAVYLAGPYKGAPYSLVIKVPAEAGPFDLGTVAVRAGIYVNPRTAQVTVVSDQLPQILQGIPVQYRDIRVLIDRPGFIQTPTSCDPMQVTASVTGTPLGGPVSVDSRGVGYSTTTGDTVQVSSPFQVGDCQALRFSPGLKLQLLGKGRTRSGGHPTLVATVAMPAREANISSAKVALPLSLALDPNNSQHVCSYDVAQAVNGGAVGCPASTIIGAATVRTPLLSNPLTGPVYLVQGIRFSHGHRIRTLPTLLIPLRGQIAIDLRANTSVNSAEQLVSTFPSVPDAAVSKFVLTINGGPKGLLVITGRGRTICGEPQLANTQFGAQSGKQEFLNPTISTPACK